MSQTQTKSTPSMAADPFGAMEFEAPREMVAQQQFQPSQVGNRTDQAMAETFLAQRVAVKREKGAILREARELAVQAGQAYFYRIPFKNKKAGTTEWVEGPSISCAMGAVSCYGNCRVEAFPAQETATHWTFVARFVDFEKGVTVMRSFQQRRGQNTGMGDGGRQEDIVFQIGQSKAMRNVVVAALPWLVEEMHKSAKGGLLQRVEKEPEKARMWLLGKFDELDIAIVRVERIVGRIVAKWLAPDMAKLFVQVQSLLDNMADPDDLFPEIAANADDLREAAEKPAPVIDQALKDEPALKPARPKKQEPVKAAKAEEETKPAPQAASEPEQETEVDHADDAHDPHDLGPLDPDDDFPGAVTAKPTTAASDTELKFE